MTMHGCKIILRKERELNGSRALTLEAYDNMNLTEQLKSPSAVVRLTSNPIYHAVNLVNPKFSFLNIKFGKPTAVFTKNLFVDISVRCYESG